MRKRTRGEARFPPGRGPAARRWRHPIGGRLVDEKVHGRESDISRPGLHEMVRVPRGRNALWPWGVGEHGGFLTGDATTGRLRVIERRYVLMADVGTMPCHPPRAGGSNGGAPASEAREERPPWQDVL